MGPTTVGGTGCTSLGRTCELVIPHNRSVTKVRTVDPQVLGDPQVLKVIPRFCPAHLLIPRLGDPQLQN